LGQNSTIDDQALERIIICRIPSAGKGFMPFLKNVPTAENDSNRFKNRSNIVFGRA
jgi:hypothetical protein